MTTWDTLTAHIFSAHSSLQFDMLDLRLTLHLTINALLLVGEVAWRLYSEKIPVDLMTLICQERNWTIDWDGFELAKHHALVHTLC